MRYWYHPESDALFKTRNDEPEPNSDGLVEEITREEYQRLIKLQREA